MDRLANLVNACAAAIAAAQARALSDAGDLTPSATAVVLTLGQFPDQTLTDLARIAGLTHSAVVRLMDGLQARGLVQRGSGRDRREVAVSLTQAGQVTYARLRQAQAAGLAPVLASLSGPERAALERASSAILAALTRDRASADHICRFCDEAICTAGGCPVEERVQALSEPGAGS